MEDRKRITEEEIESRKTEKGGWTKSTLAEWGVQWPPVKGWKHEILKNGVPIPCTGQISSRSD